MRELRIAGFNESDLEPAIPLSAPMRSLGSPNSEAETGHSLAFRKHWARHLSRRLLSKQVQRLLVALLREPFAEVHAGMFHPFQPLRSFKVRPPAIWHTHCDFRGSATWARVAIAISSLGSP